MPEQGTIAAVKLAMAGKVLKYYLNTTAVVGVDIMNAAAGWCSGSRRQSNSQDGTR